MTQGLLITLIIILVIVAAVAVLIGVIYNKVRGLSRNVFGTDSISEGIKKQKLEMSETPRSLHSMTSVYLPNILHDFPQFDYELYKNKAESILRSYFTAVENKNAKQLSEECSNTLKNIVKGIIEDLNSKNETRYFDNVVIHDTQIARYIKDGATVTIVFVSSVGYLTYAQDEQGNVVFGDKEIKTQTVYETELLYVQDADKVSNPADAIGINCPNCGAPIKNLGEKFCEYCGTAITEINIRSWKFNSVKEQTVNRKQF